MKPIRRSAWSVIELLVVIAIMGLLTAVTLPAIKGVRDQARNSTSRVYLRTHAQVFATYANDSEGSLPFLTDASEEATFYEIGGYRTDMFVFTQYATWPIALAERYYDGQAESETFHPPSSELVGPISEYWYSQSFVADSSFWIQESRQYSPSQLRGAAVHDVLFPSAKGLLFERDQAFGYFETESGSINTVLVDGSVQVPLAIDISKAYPGGVRGYLLGPIIGLPVMHTIGGVRGRDLGP